MTRDPATLMIGQYFKRKREMVEIVLVSGSGIGIAFMSVFIQFSISAIGWRLGLQAVTGVIFITFLLGTFYRSASLYHPQRRAILHLKSQKRKIKNKDKEKNKAQDDRPPYFDFTTLKSRTIQILLASIFVSSAGLYSPIFYLAQQAYSEGVGARSILYLQAYLGGAWVLGCVLFGAVVVNKSKECAISKQYLCQASLFLVGVAILAFVAVDGYNGYVMFAWVYGVFLGGYSYSLKLYLYEKVRARNFARAWGFAQFAMAFPNLVGVPATGYLNQYYGARTGYYLSAVAVILGALLMSLITLHRKNLRRKHKRHRQPSRKSIGNSSLAHLSVGLPDLPSNHSNHSHHSHKSYHSQQIVAAAAAAAAIQNDNLSSPSSRGGNNFVDLLDPQQRLSYSDHVQEDYMAPLALLGHQRSFTYDDLIDLKNPIHHHGNGGLLFEGPPEVSIFSEEGIADMDLPDHLFIDDLEFLDNITSCNKVENCVMLSEYEQNLIKEKESPTPGGRKGRKWSLFRQQSALSTEASPQLPMASTSSRRRNQSGGGGLGVVAEEEMAEVGPREIPTFANTSWRLPNSGPKRSITVIEEASV